MNNLTFIQKIKKFISGHKIWSIIILIAVVICIYFLFFNGKSSTEIRYITSTVQKGNVISSVSGTGQVESSDTLNINAKTSGEVVSVSAKLGQSVKKGDLIASIDSRDARIALENAEISLAKLKNPDSLTVLQKGNSLTKSYSDAWNNVSSFIVDADSIISGLDSLHNSYLGSQNKNLLGRTGKDKIDLSESAYWNADKSLVSLKKLYGTLSRSSSNSEIENLISKASDTSKIISNAVKLAQSGYDETYQALDQGDTTESIAAQKDLTTWTTSINSYVNSLISNGSSILEDKQSLSDTLAGSDELDIRQSELSLETKKNAYNDCFIRAPFDGIIASLTAKVGQTASGTIGTLITEQKVVKISLNEVDIASIKLDQKVTMTFDAISDLTLTGKVAEIDSVGTVSSGVVSYNVSISIDVDDKRVKPGMSVSSTIITNTAQDVLVVPTSAVKTKNGVSYVETFIQALDKTSNDTQGSISNILPTQTNVEIGVSDDTNTQIISGLKEGDIIVTKTIKGSTSTTSSTPSLLSSLMPGGNRNNISKSTTTTTKSGSSTSPSSAPSDMGAGAPPMN
jgi:HlyD family secretion protein